MFAWMQCWIFRLWPSLMQAGAICVLDRLTKHWALAELLSDFIDLNPFLRLELIMNHGISWSLFSTTSSRGLVLFSATIIPLLAIFCWYAWYEYRLGKPIWGEILAIVGGALNLYDRFLWGGVVDFIQVHWGDWAFPTFNVADMAIVCGLLFVLAKQVREGYDRQDKSSH